MHRLGTSADDFPILAARNERGQRLAFLDSAASSQKPEQVIAAVDRYYRETNANIHRGVYDLSERRRSTRRLDTWWPTSSMRIGARDRLRSEYD